MINDEHSQSILKLLVFTMLAKENFTEEQLSKKIPLHTDFLYEDVQFIVWLLKGEGSIVRINGGLGIAPHTIPYTGSFTTYRNISTNFGKTV